MSKLQSSDIAESSKYFHPAASIVNTLPNPASMKGKDLAEVLKPNSDGTYDRYQLIKGIWQKVTTTSMPTPGSSGGGSGSGGVTSVTGISPIASTGGTTPAISLNTSGVTAGSYLNSNLTINSLGLITNASNGSGPAPTLFQTTSDFPSPSNSYVDVTGLVFTGAVANTPYYLFGIVICSQGSSARGQMRIAVPSDASIFGLDTVFSTPESGSANNLLSTIGNCPLYNLASSRITTYTYVTVLIKINTAGNISMQLINEGDSQPSLCLVNSFFAIQQLS